MNIDKLQKALAIFNKDGKSGEIYGYHDVVEIYPMTDSFTKEEVAQIESLGFMPTDCEDGWQCFT